MRHISVDNGAHWCTPAEALKVASLDEIAQYMDDGVRERVHFELVPCTEEEFLTRYLELAPADIIIG